MRLDIGSGDNARVEHISDGDRTLLQAAYVAVLLNHELTDTFGQGQIHIFREYLQPNKTPIPRDIITNNRFLDLLDHWFKGRLLESLEPYKDDASVAKPFPFTYLCKQIRIAVGAPKDQQDIVTAWLTEEVLDAKARKIRKSIRRK